jgi:hypothetical protein
VAFIPNIPSSLGAISEFDKAITELLRQGAGDQRINLMKGKMRRVRRLRTSRAPSRSCIAGIRQVTRISQTTPLSSAAMFRFPHLGTPQSNSGAAGCGTIRILALSKGCISSAECLLMAHHGPAARCKPNVKLLHSDSRV